MSKVVDITGQMFGKLLVISRVPNAKNGKAVWNCKCDCGNAVTVWGSNLRNGHTKSCGCLISKITCQRNTVHGKARTRIHNVWKGMKQRCTNQNNHKYKNYVGRGITVCDEWKNSFQAFYDHISTLPNFGEKGYSLDRINNDGNYEPGNVRWATAHMQRINQRKRVTK